MARRKQNGSDATPGAPASRRGGARPNSGRPKGGLSQVTKSIREYVAEHDCDPLVAIAELLIWHRSQWREAATRFEADPDDQGALRLALEMSERAADYASKLSPYCAPRLASIDANVSGSVGLQVVVVRQGGEA